MNGKTKVTIGTVSGVSVIGFIAIFNFLTGPIKEDIEEVKERHDKDIAVIREDVKKIPTIEANVKHIMCEQKTMKDDIKEILRAVK